VALVRTGVALAFGWRGDDLGMAVSLEKALRSVMGWWR
jgi:hypothetical protein